jgi:hypothetical protein
MTILMRKVGEDLYSVSAAAPLYRGGQTWAPEHPLNRDQIAEELMSRGYHVQDIGDAFAEADRAKERGSARPEPPGSAVR